MKHIVVQDIKSETGRVCSCILGETREFIILL